jgi:hypothetical protein
MKIRMSAAQGVDDLSNFAAEWLFDNLETPWNVNRTGRMNIENLALISKYWLFEI